MKTYDAIVVGAGHNGLTTAAYSRQSRARCRLCREERLHRRCDGQSRTLQGLEVFELLVCMQSVAPRDLSLARAAQARLAGDTIRWLARSSWKMATTTVPIMTRKLRIARWRGFSKHDADAYERYRADTMRQCRFIRDTLLRTATRPDVVQAEGHKRTARHRQQVHGDGRGPHVRDHSLLDHERRRISRRVFRNRRHQDG